MNKGLFTILLLLTTHTCWAEEIHIRSRLVKSASLNPQNKVWQSIQPIAVPLIKQTFVSPQGGGAVKKLFVKALHTDKEFFLYLEWEDKTKSSQLDVSGKFSDACAVQFPLKDGELPSPFMGNKGNPVNIWYWRAVAKETERYAKAYSDFYRQDAIENTIQFDENSVQNLIAEGFGSLTTASVQEIEGSGIWKNGKWSVVMKRKLNSESGAIFKTNSVVPIAFAVWDGGTQERDGIKSLSFWHFIQLGDAKIDSPTDPIERGKKVFARYGCETCHGAGGRGGIKNINAQGGEVPPLNKLAEGFTEEEVKKIIREGRTSVPEDVSGPFPSLHMTNWNAVMDEKELSDLVKFLFSISAKSEEWK